LLCFARDAGSPKVLMASFCTAPEDRPPLGLGLLSLELDEGFMMDAMR
jgi:hypothetical protein